jgi:hypothetical protein
MTSRSRFLTLLVIVTMVLVSLVGCSASGTPDDNTLSGVISEVSGDLTTVTGFVVLAEDGSSHRFIPKEGLLFEGGSLTHLREHVVTGQRVVVTFESGPDGALVAVAVEDA